MIEHIALAHRNSGSGWVIMATEGRLGEAEAVSHDRPLQAMLDEGLSFLASHPAADFTFSTRSANDVQASPYDGHADLLDIERDLARSNISVMVPYGDRWCLLHKAPGRWFERIDVCGPDDVFSYLRQWPGDAETVQRGLAGPVEVFDQEEDCLCAPASLGLLVRAVHPLILHLGRCEQDWHSLVIDRLDKRVRRCGHEREDVDLDRRAILLDGSDVTAPESGKREKRPRFFACECKPIPSCWLHICIRLTKASHWHETAALAHGVSPECRLHLVVTGISDAPGRLSRLREHEAPRQLQQLALAILSATDHRRHVTREDRVLWLEVRCAVRRNAEEPPNGFNGASLRVEIAHSRPIDRQCARRSARP